LLTDPRARFDVRLLAERRGFRASIFSSQWAKASNCACQYSLYWLIQTAAA
jgi:hypothetical protein